MKLTSLWSQLKEKHPKSHARWVPAHSDVVGNEVADYGPQLANAGIFNVTDTKSENYTHKQLRNYLMTQKTISSKNATTNTQRALPKHSEPKPTITI